MNKTVRMENNWAMLNLYNMAELDSVCLWAAKYCDITLSCISISCTWSKTQQINVVSLAIQKKKKFTLLWFTRFTVSQNNASVTFKEIGVNSVQSYHFPEHLWMIVFFRERTSMNSRSFLQKLSIYRCSKSFYESS